MEDGDSTNSAVHALLQTHWNATCFKPLQLEAIAVRKELHVTGNWHCCCGTQTA
jgi:hypothetical protein